MTLQKQKRIKSKAITNSARGENCTLRIYGVCNGNPETTVFAHAKGGGMGMKAHDIHGCYACSSCHEWIDGGWTRPMGEGIGIQAREKHKHQAIMESEVLRAMMKTQTILFQKGLIKL
mgnify:CR=1 FL=1